MDPAGQLVFGIIILLAIAAVIGPRLIKEEKQNWDI